MARLDDLSEWLDRMVADPNVWDLIAGQHGELIALLWDAVRDAVVNDPRRLLTLCYNKLCQPGLPGQVLQYHRWAYPGGDCTSLSERSLANSRRLLATARVAVNAVLAEANQHAPPEFENCCDDVRVAATIALREFGNPSDPGHALPGRAKAHKIVCDVFGGADQPCLGPLLWAEYWLRRPSLGASTDVKVAGYASRGFIATLSLWRIGGPVGGQLVEHPEICLNPTGPAFLSALETAALSVPDCSFCWQIAMPSGLNSVRLDGGSAGGAVAAALRLAAAGRPCLTDRVVTAALGADGALEAVAHERDKLEAAARARLVRGGVGRGSHLTGIDRAALTALGLDVTELPTVQDAVDYLDGTPVSSPNASAPTTTIAVVGTKGGVGKGTVVAFGAQMAAFAGQDVAIIDLDLHSSGTTLSAESKYGNRKPVNIKTAFDHLAPHATTLKPYAAGKDDGLWDITPKYLQGSGSGRIWLLPARRRTNVNQSFDVVANIPAESREKTLAKVLSEMIARIRRKQPNTGVIFIDCGAERNPVYAAAFYCASFGYILTTPNPDYFGEVAGIRDELASRFVDIEYDPEIHNSEERKQELKAVTVATIDDKAHAILNRTKSGQEFERVRHALLPIPLNDSISNDHILYQDTDDGVPNDLDLGYEEVAYETRSCLARATPAGSDIVPSVSKLINLPIWSHVFRDGEVEEVLTPDRTRDWWERAKAHVAPLTPMLLAAIGIVLCVVELEGVSRWVGIAVCAIGVLSGAFTYGPLRKRFVVANTRRHEIVESGVEVAKLPISDLWQSMEEWKDRAGRESPGILDRIVHYVRGRQRVEKQLRKNSRGS